MTQMYLDDRDLQNYGPAMVDFTTRAASQAIEPRLQQLDAQNNELRWQIARETKARLDRQLEQEIPNFREIDADPRWLAWLKGHDSISGRNRQQLLDEAIADGNIDRVLATFRSFMAAYLHPGEPEKASRTRSASASAPRGRTYSREDVKRLYEMKRQGAFANREAEWQELERDLFAAGREGRVVGAITDIAGR